jgi:peptidoglycan hydrolase-like protein with peptidoglycan-binding domain
MAIALLLLIVPLAAQASSYGDKLLSRGSRGGEVGLLQQDLTFLGYNTYGVDGIFGPNTEKAVIRFQQSKGLAPDGIVGSQTKAALSQALNSASAGQNLSLGSRGTAVSQLQQNLTRLGFDTYGVDGIFGNNTRNAVISFQKSRGISSDGIVGPNTRNAINTALANISNTPSPGNSGTDTGKYPKLSKVNGSFGQFHYRELSGGRIEVDPQWIADNIVTITLPGLNRQVQVNKAAKDNFIKAFTLIANGTATVNGKQVSLLSLINTMDGTFVTRHVNWNPANGLSNHSWGTAIDINASSHFRYVNPSSEPNDPNVILWEKAFKPAGFSWGNSYGDSMHYELLK